MTPEEEHGAIAEEYALRDALQRVAVMSRPPGSRGPHLKRGRNAAIRLAAALGASYLEIAAEFRLSGQRVAQILGPRRHTLDRIRAERRADNAPAKRTRWRSKLATDRALRLVRLREEGLSLSAIAAQMGWTYNAASVNVTRARKRLGLPISEAASRAQLERRARERLEISGQATTPEGGP